MEYTQLVTALLTICLASGVLGQTKTCADVSTDACNTLLKTHPDLCKDTCFANICKETCGYCPLSCYHCVDEVSPESCTKVVQCSRADQLCLTTERLDANLNSVYESGCAEKGLCEHLFGYTRQRKDEDMSERSYHLHGGCCETDLCNVHDPDNTTVTPDPDSTRPPRPTDGSIFLAQNTTRPADINCSAHDLNGGACLLLAIADPKICQNKCVAETLCQESCGTCLECYDCQRVSRPDECQNKVRCQLNQKCVAVKTLGADFSVGYKLGCIDQHICDSVFHSSLPMIGKRQINMMSSAGQCCGLNGCNKFVLPAEATTPQG